MAYLSCHLQQLVQRDGGCPARAVASDSACRAFPKRRVPWTHRLKAAVMVFVMRTQLPQLLVLLRQQPLQFLCSGVRLHGAVPFCVLALLLWRGLSSILFGICPQLVSLDSGELFQVIQVLAPHRDVDSHRFVLNLRLGNKSSLRLQLRDCDHARIPECRCYTEPSLASS